MQRVPKIGNLQKARSPLNPRKQQKFEHLYLSI